MDFSQSSTIAFAAGAVGILIYTLSKPSQGPTPPGPRGWPIIGNALNIPSKDPWKVYLQWSKDYGSDILFISLPRHSLVVLNSEKATRELMIQRSSNYADRPQSTMLSNLMNMSWMLGLMPYGNQWKLHRKIFRREFENPEDVIRNHIVHATRRLLARLLHSKVNYARDLQLSTADVILSATYGITPKTEDDFFIRLVESQVTALTEVVRKPYLVDMFPILRYVPKWFPGATFRRQAEEWERVGSSVRNLPYEHVKSEAAKGVAAPSVALQFLATAQNDETGAEENSEDFLRNVLAEAYIGGAGATVGNLCSFVLAMALHPDVQRKAQAAVDTALVSHSHRRLPDFSDYGQIPYLDAVVSETLRWNPGAPLGVFHAVTKDDWYNGYFIPAGSFITGNTWAILHDESAYGERVEDFIPERFLTAEGERNKSVPDPEAAFGFGRRICPGRVLGSEILWMTAASLLATYNIGKPVDRDGKPLDPHNLEYSNSMSSRPPYFDVVFTRRGGVSEALIQEGANE